MRRATYLLLAVVGLGCATEDASHEDAGEDAGAPVGVVCGEAGEFLTLPLSPTALDGCRWFRGNVHVPDWYEAGLTPLRDIEGIDGRLTFFRNHGLSDLGDLSRLTHLGGELSIRLDDSGGLFTSVDGLESLRETGGLTLDFNPGLADLRGLSGLTAVHGDVLIRGNAALPQSEIDWLLSRIEVDGEVVAADNLP